LPSLPTTSPNLLSTITGTGRLYPGLSISTALIYHKLPLFILVAGRPETPIRNSFNSYDLREMIHKVILDESSEIRRFLSSKVKQIQETHPLCTHIPSARP
jgi:hypothetical protein